MTQISDRLRGLVQSDIRRMSRECERVGGINLGQGICDLPTIPELVEGACDAIVANKATYSKFEGIDILRERIAKKLAHYNGLKVDPATEIVVTVGSSGGFLNAAMATLNAGDEVILFEPYYGYHLNTLTVLGFVPKFVPLQAPDWSIDFDALRAAFTPKTKAIVVCTPSNPSGKMFTRAEIEKIGALCREFNAWIFTDEIYEYIVYDGRKHVSPASIPSCRDIAITISGFSKTFSITGWRIGYAVADARVAGPIGLMNDLFPICAPTPLPGGAAGRPRHNRERGRRVSQIFVSTYSCRRTTVTCLFPKCTTSSRSSSRNTVADAVILSSPGLTGSTTNDTLFPDSFVFSMR